MRKLAKFAQENYGYALAFVVGALFNHYVLGSSKNQLDIPAWVAWVIPFVLFIVLDYLVMVATRNTKASKNQLDVPTWVTKEKK